MNISSFDSYEAMGEEAARLVLEVLDQKGKASLCVATGSSPLGTYRALVGAHKREPQRFAGLHLIKLDEWEGLPKGHPASCEHYLREELLGPLGIPPQRYLGFDPTPGDPKEECERIQRELDERPPIDLCILGLGKNGHIGMNEPAPALQPHCHLAQLSQTSQNHGMIRDLDPRPQLGMTLGMGNILTAKRILLLVHGPGKGAAMAALREKKVATDLPASFLWLHPKVDCFLVRGQGYDRRS